MVPDLGPTSVSKPHFWHRTELDTNRSPQQARDAALIIAQRTPRESNSVLLIWGSIQVFRTVCLGLLPLGFA